MVEKQDTCTPVLIAALFASAKAWKQPRCPSTDEWVKMLCTYKYTMKCYLSKKRTK